METKFEPLINLYTRNGFGNCLKSEIDLIMFDILLQLKLPELLSENKKHIDYYKIDKKDITKISQELVMKQSRVQSMIEKAVLHFPSKPDINTFISEYINKKNWSKELFNNGYVKIYCPNPNMRLAIENKISNIGGIPDYSFNRDILNISIIDLFTLLDKDFSKTEFKKLLEKIQNTITGEESKKINDEIKKLIKNINKKNWKEHAKSIFKEILKKHLTEAGVEALSSFWQSVTKNK